MNRSSPYSIWFHSENGPTIGGSDFYLGRLIDGLDQDWWDVTMLARPGYPVHRITSNVKRVKRVAFGPELQLRPSTDCESEMVMERPVDLPPKSHMINRVWSATPRTWRRDFGLLRDVARLTKLMRAHHPNLVHSTDGGAQPVALAAARAGVPVVLGYSAPPPVVRSRGLLRRLEQDAFRAANVRITKSRFARDDWAQYLGQSPDAFTVIPNGIDVQPYIDVEPQEARRTLGLPVDSLIVGMTARIEPEKGIGVFLESIRLFGGRRPDLHFVVTGEGTALMDSMRTVEEHGLSRRVTFLGNQSNIPLVAAAYDIGIVPSIWNEPFGWTVLESMAAAKPVVASRVGGIPEIVQHEETGLLVSPDSPLELHDAIERLAESPAQRQTLGRNGRQRVVQHFGRQQMLEATYQQYQSLLDDRPTKVCDTKFAGQTAEAR